MAALKSRDLTLEINYLGIASDDPELIIAEVGMLAGGMPILNDALCYRMHTAKPGYFEFWQDREDGLVTFLFERIERNDWGMFRPRDEEDLYLLVVPGWGFPFMEGEAYRTGVDMGEPSFTVLVRPAGGVNKALGAELAMGQGIIQQLHVTRDELADFAVSLQDELHAAFEVMVSKLPPTDPTVPN